MPTVLSRSRWRMTLAIQKRPALARRWFREEAAHHQRNRCHCADLMQKRQREEQEAHLADRRIAEEPLDIGLFQADQVGEKERGSARHGEDGELVFKEGEQFHEREEYAGGNADGNDRGDAARRGFIDVEPPAIGGKRLQFDDEAGKQEKQCSRADWSGDVGLGGNQGIDAEGAGDIIEQTRAEQEEGRRDDRRHDELERRRQRGRCPLEPEKAIGRNGDDLQEDEEIEEIPGHHHAVDAHGEDQIEQQRRVVAAQPIPKMQRAQDGQDIDADGDKSFGRGQSAD